MPMILKSSDYDRRVDKGTSMDDARAMLKPYDPELMKSYEVSRVVNSVRNDTEECIEPVTA